MQLLLVLSCVAVLLLRSAKAEDCADKKNGCPGWADRGFCAEVSRYHDYMMNNCKLSCGQCGGCADKKDGCPGWANQGFCAEVSIYHGYMTKNCQRSCGLCGGLVTNPPPTTEAKGGQGGGQGGGHGGEAQGGAAACLKVHNDKRALHEGTPALQWDDDLARQAKQWADYLLRINQMKHSSASQRPNQGENLYMAQRFSVATCTSAVEAWYSEVDNYPFYSPPRGIGGGIGGRAIGHFTQIVWKNTRKVGVGVASGERGGYVVTYIVARYSPPGNYVGQFAEQVGNLERRG